MILGPNDPRAITGKEREEAEAYTERLNHLKLFGRNWRLRPEVADDPKSIVYCLHGVADRDPNELVCMFFEHMAHLEQFVEAVPMRHHQVVVLAGLSYEALTVTDTLPSEFLV